MPIYVYPVDTSFQQFLIFKNSRDISLDLETALLPTCTRLQCSSSRHRSTPSRNSFLKMPPEPIVSGFAVDQSFFLNYFCFTFFFITFFGACVPQKPWFSKQVPTVKDVFERWNLVV